MIEPRPTDKAFKTSPDTGHPDCLCSRCGRPITEDEAALRMLTTNEKGRVVKSSLEYRYCEDCQGAAGIYIHKPFDPRKVYDWWDLYP